MPDDPVDAVIRAFLALPNEAKGEFSVRFHELVPLTADNLRYYLDLTPPEEQTRFIEVIIPGLLTPQAVERIVQGIAAGAMPTIQKAMAEAVAKAKKKRDRKSGPEIIRRNIEICDLRRQDKKRQLCT